MYIEKRYIKRIEKIFEQLSLSIRLLDTQGVCIVPEGGEGEALPVLVMAAGITHRVSEHLYRALDMNPPLILTCQAGEPGAENILVIADAMLMSMFKSNLSIATDNSTDSPILQYNIVPFFTYTCPIFFWR